MIILRTLPVVLRMQRVCVNLSLYRVGDKTSPCADVTAAPIATRATLTLPAFPWPPKASVTLREHPAADLRARRVTRTNFVSILSMRRVAPAM